ncbi:MAG: iron-containing alcohol dehydrogenase [Anaerolineae bacterium]
MPTFEFATAQRIIFGRGVFDQLAPIAAEHGRRVFLVAAQHALADGGPVDGFTAKARDLGLALTVQPVGGEPDVASVDAAAERARSAGADVVIGLGGGSALDTAKAVAGLLTNGGPVLDYMEVVGKGLPLKQPAAPFLAVPTTAGPGSEVTRNAVVTDKDRAFKASVRSPSLLARVALVDPLLTVGLPPGPTASTGMDALTQLIEAYVSRRANPLTDAIVMGALGRGARALPRAWSDGADLAAREDMCFASLCSGLALANAALGAVHGFASPLGGHFPVPHGVACARLLPPVMAANVAALRALPPDAPAGSSTASDTLWRYAQVGMAVAGPADDAIDAGIAWAAEEVARLRVPGLRQYGMTEADLPEMVRLAQGASSMKGNPVTLDEGALVETLRQALD